MDEGITTHFLYKKKISLVGFIFLKKIILRGVWFSKEKVISVFVHEKQCILLLRKLFFIF